MPLLVWLGTAAAVVVFLVGLGTYASHSAAADACTVGDYGRIYVIEDTPSCDAATDDRDLGRTFMVAGGGAAIGLPVRGLVSTRRTGRRA